MLTFTNIKYKLPNKWVTKCVPRIDTNFQCQNHRAFETLKNVYKFEEQLPSRVSPPGSISLEGTRKCSSWGGIHSRRVRAQVRSWQLRERPHHATFINISWCFKFLAVPWSPAVLFVVLRAGVGFLISFWRVAFGENKRGKLSTVLNWISDRYIKIHDLEKHYQMCTWRVNYSNRPSKLLSQISNTLLSLIDFTLVLG